MKKVNTRTTSKLLQAIMLTPSEFPNSVVMKLPAGDGKMSTICLAVCTQYPSVTDRQAVRHNCTNNIALCICRRAIKMWSWLVSVTSSLTSGINNLKTNCLFVNYIFSLITNDNSKSKRYKLTTTFQQYWLYYRLNFRKPVEFTDKSSASAITWSQTMTTNYNNWRLLFNKFSVTSFVVFV